MIISAPASTANVGPAFDAIGIALELAFELADQPQAAPDGERPWHVAEATHPASVAYRRAGGDGALWWRSPIPPGRGLGFSAAARVAGAALAATQSGADLATTREQAFAIAAELEDHPDNAAPAAFGGVVAAAAGQAVPVPLATPLDVVVWSPAHETATASSRSRLPDAVPFADASFNIGRTALLVAALATGRSEALAAATDDRLHQRQRLAALDDSCVALDVMTEHTIAAWLSGSGPSIAAFVEPDRSIDDLDEFLPPGRCRRLAVDQTGVVVKDASA